MVALILGDEGGLLRGTGAGSAGGRTCRALAAFRDMMTPSKVGKMYMSSLCSLPASWKWTHIFPMGHILWPLATRGLNSDGKRFSLYSFRGGRIFSPAAEISAPESGSIAVRTDPWIVLTSTMMVGAGSMVATCLTLRTVIDVVS